MKKALFLSGMAGLLLPLADICLWSLGFTLINQHWELYSQWTFIRLFLYPSSLMLLGTASNNNLAIVTVLLSVAMNSALYILVAFFVWLGIKRYIWILYLILPALGFGWFLFWRVLTGH